MEIINKIYVLLKKKKNNKRFDLSQNLGGELFKM